MQWSQKPILMTCNARKTLWVVLNAGKLEIETVKCAFGHSRKHGGFESIRKQQRKLNEYFYVQNEGITIINIK